MDKHNLSQYLPEESELGYGEHHVSRTKCINVLLVGRSQSGKSSIVETLLEPQQAISGTGFTITTDPVCNCLIVMNKNTNEAYQLNIIDTPGLQEIRENEESRSDEELLKLASKCVEYHITSLNVVCYVSIAGKTHVLDAEVFDKFKHFLGDDFSDISMMVLTHCDEFSDKDLTEFENSFGNHNITKPYIDYCKLGIVRYGAVDYKKLESYKEMIRKHVVEDKLERIEIMRDNFIKKIISCADKAIMTDELQFIYDESVKAKQNAIEEELNKVTQKYDEKFRQQEEYIKVLEQKLLNQKNLNNPEQENVIEIET